MVSIVIGLVNGLTVINLELKLLFSVVLLMAIYVADHPAILPSSENLRLKFTVDRLIFGKIELEDYLSKVLNAEIKDLIILEIDTVREIMVVDVRIKRVSGEK
jgi:hypothetical protein